MSINNNYSNIQNQESYSAPSQAVPTSGPEVTNQQSTSSHIQNQITNEEISSLQVNVYQNLQQLQAQQVIIQYQQELQKLEAQKTLLQYQQELQELQAQKLLFQQLNMMQLAQQLQPPFYTPLNCSPFNSNLLYPQNFYDQNFNHHFPQGYGSTSVPLPMPPIDISQIPYIPIIPSFAVNTNPQNIPIEPPFIPFTHNPIPSIYNPPLNQSLSNQLPTHPDHSSLSLPHPHPQQQTTPSETNPDASAVHLPSEQVVDLFEKNQTQIIPEYKNPTPSVETLLEVSSSNYQSPHLLTVNQNSTAPLSQKPSVDTREKTNISSNLLKSSYRRSSSNYQSPHLLTVNQKSTAPLSQKPSVDTREKTNIS
ncbi:MAG: hypothetical protein ACOVOR_05070, partial [Rhabdochlamydiaceae bacterium]